MTPLEPTPPEQPGPLHRLFALWVRHRWVATLLVVAASAPLAALAGRVRTDQSVEHMFPVHDETRRVYDRYKDVFPYDDAHALVVLEGSDLWTEAGLRRVQALEKELGLLPGVVQVRGPLSARDVTGEGDTVYLARLFPSPDMPADERQAALATARSDPLFRWSLASPERDVASIRVRLSTETARDDEGRRAFNAAADRVIAAHAHEWDRALLTGIPVIRGRYIEMVQTDKELLLPLAYVVINVVVALAYRSVIVVLGTVLTIGAALLWTVAGMAVLDMPFTILTAFAPIIVMIISISDTVHIATDLDGRMRGGAPRAEALAAAMAHGAGPCLLTEITIACGFLAMVLVDITAVSEFGIVSALGMMLAWLANMTVLPLALSFYRVRGGAGSPAPDGGAAPGRARPLLLRSWERFVGWIEQQVTRRPRRVVASACVLLGGCALGAVAIEKVHFVFDDLWPASQLWRDLRYAEGARGGLVPLAVFLEPEQELAARSEAPALEPAALRFLDGAEHHMRALGEEGRHPIVWASSVARYLRKAHPLFAGEERAAREGGLPADRAVAAQELLVLDDGFVFSDLLSIDHTRAAVITHLPDMAAPRVQALLAELRAWVEANEPEGYDAHVTGVLAISNRVYEILLEGLLKSFAAALAVTLAVFALVLRSARLAVIGAIPNVAPIFLMLGAMAALGIDLKVSTVLLFSMVLVIADDDTIQYLSRFRRRYVRLARAGAPDPHRRAALSLLHELGLPMFVTSSSVAAGFLLLCFSEFRATANLGLIAGITLFAAVFADLFLAPIIIGWWRPRIAGLDGRGG